MTEAELVAVVEAKAREGSWNAAAWLLERRYPKRWTISHRQAEPAPAPRERPAADQDAMAEVIKLARG